MIILLMIITKVAANIDADFYAVQIKQNDYSYTVFTRVGNCSVYKSDTQGIYGSLFFQNDGKWNIGQLKRFDEINCENISSFVNPKLYQPFRQKSLKKCVEISSLGIDKDEARVEHGNSKKKEDCENASYWEEKYPKENVFVSYYQSECLYDLDRHVTLVPNPNQMLIIYSSCDQTESTLIGNINKAVEIGKAKQSQEEGIYDRNFIIYVSVGGVGVLILIVVVNVLLIRKIKRNVTIVDENAIYGRHEPAVYYEDGKNTQIEDKNEYYG